MQTYTGRQYWPLDPRAEDVDIIDIAHALSMLCRYTGHCKDFYSVAEHCVYVSRCVPEEHALQGLMHDAQEAYCNDIARPLKRFILNYEEIEGRNWRVIAEKFGLPFDLHPSVKYADISVLLAEAAVLLGPAPAPWSFGDIKAADIEIRASPPAVAESMFLARFKELTSW